MNNSNFLFYAPATVIIALVIGLTIHNGTIQRKCGDHAMYIPQNKPNTQFIMLSKQNFIK